MLDRFVFENHLGQRFSGLENGVYMISSNLRDYTWNFETINGRISRFYNSVQPRRISLWIRCKSEDEAVKVKNRLHELSAVDIEAKLPGKVYLGEYYTTGYITESVKSKFLIDKQLCKLDLKLTSDDPAWYMEQTHPFFGTEGSAGGISGADYPYDYPYDYANSLKGRSIVCDTVGSNAFRLLIYGEAVNPSIVIGGHVYTVNGTIGKGETLLIDSMNKTITLTTATGKVNWFDKRNRDSYIFEPIPAGKNTVSWNGNFGFDLTVIEKRSEPKWT